VQPCPAVLVPQEPLALQSIEPTSALQWPRAPPQPNAPLRVTNATVPPCVASITTAALVAPGKFAVTTNVCLALAQTVERMQNA
jgi:uncharacterized protein YqcC (DUF446 family)